MRTALAAALMIAATIGWADEPSVPNATTEPAAATSTETAKRPFKPPAGYRLKRINGEAVYCTKVAVYNSRFSTDECRTEAQLRDMERSKQSGRNEMDRLSRACSHVGCTH